LTAIEIGLVRHFPTEWNAEGRLQGHTDIPLSAEGRAELGRARLPERWRGCKVIASPLSRAWETAQHLAESGPPRADERLREMRFGDWEGRIGAELLADPACPYRPLEAWGWDFTPPGGESPREMLARALEVIGACTEPTVIVSHRGLMRSLLGAATGWGYDGPMPFKVRKAHLHPLFIENGRPVRIGAPEPLL
jgi:probable phosphoglycerate mutase